MFVFVLLFVFVFFLGFGAHPFPNCPPPHFRALQRDLKTLSPIFFPVSKSTENVVVENEERNVDKINPGDLIAVIVFQRSCVDLAGL